MNKENNLLTERVEEIYKYQVDPDYVLRKMTKLEGISRRNNLRVDGITKDERNVGNV